MSACTFRTLLRENYKKWKEEPFLYERKSQGYQPMSFGQVIETSISIAHGLIDLGLKGKNIAIFAENSAMWMCADLAVMSYVGISIGFSKEYGEEDLVRSIEKFEVDALFYSDAKNEIVDRILPQFPKLRTFNLDHLEELIANGCKIAAEKDDLFDFSTVENIDNVKPNHVHTRVDQANPEHTGVVQIKIEETRAENTEVKQIQIEQTKVENTGVEQAKIEQTKAEKPDFQNTKHEDVYFQDENIFKDCVKVVLTAGTTSMPKGVCLSEKNIFAGFESLSKRAPMDHNDICYLFLPLHHTYAGIYNFIYSLISGMKIYLSSGVAHIAEELQLVNPTVFCGVPVIFKNFYHYAASDHKILSKCFGNRIKYLFTGGAYLEEDIREFYHRSGLKLLSAYALSETSSSLAIDYQDTKNYVSCGRVFEDIEVKIEDADESGVGEILVKGDCVFLGYMNDEKATRESFDRDGFFKTGDLGFLDKENNIYLTGRKKKVLLSSHGENIYPDDIEQKLKAENDNINKIMIFLAEDELRAHFFIQKEDGFHYEELIENYNENVPNYRKIKGFEVFIDSVDKRLKQ